MMFKTNINYNGLYMKSALKYTYLWKNSYLRGKIGIWCGILRFLYTLLCAFLIAS